MSEAITSRAQALEALRAPRFGDPRCCEAVAWLEAFEELGQTRVSVQLGKRYECPCCQGTGEMLCGHCGNFAECHTCNGMGGWQTVADWERGVYMKCLEVGTVQSLKARIRELKALTE